MPVPYIYVEYDTIPNILLQCMYTSYYLYNIRKSRASSPYLITGKSRVGGNWNCIVLKCVGLGYASQAQLRGQ